MGNYVGICNSTLLKEKVDLIIEKNSKIKQENIQVTKYKKIIIYLQKKCKKINKKIKSSKKVKNKKKEKAI